MTTIPQLPEAVIVNPTDQIMIDQSGTSGAVSVATLQSGLQPKLTVAQGALLGRVSLDPGQPEPVGLGPGLTLAAGAVAVDTTQIAKLASPALTGTPTAPTPAITDSSDRVATTSFVQAKYFQPVTLTGDATGFGSTLVPVTLPAITTPGTFAKVTVNAKGQVTGGTATLTPTDISGLATVAKSGSYADLSNSPAPYVLSAATAASLGGVKPGANLAVVADGTLSVSPVGMDASSAIATATGTNLARSLNARFGETYNVLDYGADPTGVTDFSAAFQSLASRMPASGGTIRFPRGTYRFNIGTYLPDKALLEIDGGVVFLGNGRFNADADTSILSSQQAAKSFMRLGGTDANSWTVYASQLIAVTTGTVSYEKAAIYATAASYDPSTYTSGTSFDMATTFKDTVGLQATGTVLPGNAQGRAWGIATQSTISPGSDGLAIGIEADLANNGAAQPENNRWNTKIGVSIVSFGPNAGTNGCAIINGGGTWFDGYAVFKNAVTRYAFVLRDLSNYPSTTPAYIDASGNAGFQNLNAAGAATIGALTATGVASFTAGLADASYSVQAPLTGFAITVPNGVSTLLLIPAGPLAAGSITLPAAPVDGQWLLVSSTAAIAACTFAGNAGQTVLGAPSALPAGVEVAFIWQQAAARWVCQSGNDQRLLTALQSKTTSPYAAAPIFGTGADGTVTISSGTTTLTRDMQYANLTISGTGRINTQGYKIRVAGTLDISAAGAAAINALPSSGTNPSGATGGSGAGGGIVQPALDTPYPGWAVSGGNGTLANGQAGSAPSQPAFMAAGRGGAGGAGGGGTGAGGAGGAGIASGFYGPTVPQFADGTPHGSVTIANTVVALAGAMPGSGGGGGGGDGSSAGGGGGCGQNAPSLVAVYARFINRSASTAASCIQSISVPASNGANAVGGNAGGGGGGGGAGGGIVIVVCESLMGAAATNCIDVSGTSGGTGGTGSGTGRGGNGGAGGGSGAFYLVNLGVPSLTTASVSPNTAGAAGSATTTSTGGIGGAGTISRGTL